MWDCGKRSNAAVKALGGGGGSAARVLSVFLLINKALSYLTESRLVWQEIRSNFIQVIGLQNPQNFPQEERRGVGRISSLFQQNMRSEEGVETKGKGPREKGPFICLEL
jgi:hypothetical protein